MAWSELSGLDELGREVLWHMDGRSSDFFIPRLDPMALDQSNLEHVKHLFLQISIWKKKIKETPWFEHGTKR